MKFGKSKTEKFYKFDVDFEDKEYTMLKEYGLKEIQKDSDALINYAVNKILKDAVKVGKTDFKKAIKSRKCWCI